MNFFLTCGNKVPNRQGFFMKQSVATVGTLLKCGSSKHKTSTYMDKDTFYSTVYKLVEDYFTNFSKKPHYLLINSKFDLRKYLEDHEDLKQYVNDKFKGMTIVRTPDISSDKVVVY